MKTGKKIIGLAAALLVMLSFGIAQGGVKLQCPPDADGVDTDGDGVVDNDVVCMHVGGGDGFATMADGRTMYMFGFSSLMDGSTMLDGDTALMHGMMAAEFPAPRIVLKEGQKFYLTMTNVGMTIRPDLFDPHTVHWHGFANAASVFDGVPDASIAVNMMSSLTYYYEAVDPGTYMWHCHVEATEHMQMGMLGQLWVEPIQNNLADGTTLDNGFVHSAGYKYAYNDGDGSTYYDVEFPLQLGSFDPNFHDASESVQPLPFAEMKDKYAMINGRGYPDTVNPMPVMNEFGHHTQIEPAIITAVQGEKVLLRMSSLSTTDYFTVTALGVPMRVVGKGARLLRGPTGQDLSYYTGSVTLGGGESVDVILETADLEPGTYFLYTTNLQYLSNNLEDFGGMMTEIVITAPVPVP